MHISNGVLLLVNYGHKYLHFCKNKKRLCGLNFFVHSPFFQACLKTLGFLSHLFTIDNFKPGFWVGSPQTTIKRLGTTTCGSLSRPKYWEPQLVAPNQNQ